MNNNAGSDFPYNDIINLPHHTSPKRKHMSLLDRAAQFSPFAALTGYDEDVKEAEKGVMLVAPGGGYCMCVPHEGEPVALDFYERGYDVYVLAYTTDITFSFPLKDQPLKDIARAVRLIRRARLDAGIRDEKLFICGFSAGYGRNSQTERQQRR